MLTCRSLLVIISLVIPAIAQSDSLMVMKEDYGQFSYNTALQSRVRTLEYEDSTTVMVENILKNAGVDYRMQLRHWPIAYRRATNRENYALFPVERSPRDEGRFEYVGPITQYKWVVYTRANSELEIDSIDDLRSLEVGGYENSPFVSYLKSEGIEVSTLPYDALNLKRLVLDFIDVWVSYDENVDSIVQQSSYPAPKAAWTVKTVDIYLGINRQSNRDTIRSIQQSFPEVLVRSTQ